MNKTVQKLLQLGKLNFNSIGAIFKTDKCPDFYECNDGTFSTSNGRGACAGHGGLKNKPKRQAKKKSTVKQRIKTAAKKRNEFEDFFKSVVSKAKAKFNIITFPQQLLDMLWNYYLSTNNQKKSIHLKRIINILNKINLTSNQIDFIKNIDKEISTKKGLSLTFDTSFFEQFTDKKTLPEKSIQTKSKELNQNVFGLMPGDYIKATMNKGKYEGLEYILRYQGKEFENKLTFAVEYVKAKKIWDRVRAYGFLPKRIHDKILGELTKGFIRVDENDYKIWCESRKCVKLDKLPTMLDLSIFDINKAEKKNFDNRLLRLCEKSTFGSENMYQVYYSGRWVGSIVGNRSDAIKRTISQLPGLLDKEVVRKGCNVIPKSERQAATEETQLKEQKQALSKIDCPTKYQSILFNQALCSDDIELKDTKWKILYFTKPEKDTRIPGKFIFPFNQFDFKSKYELNWSIGRDNRQILGVNLNIRPFKMGGSIKGFYIEESLFDIKLLLAILYSLASLKNDIKKYSNDVLKHILDVTGLTVVNDKIFINDEISPIIKKIKRKSKLFIQNESEIKRLFKEIYSKIEKRTTIYPGFLDSEIQKMFIYRFFIESTYRAIFENRLIDNQAQNVIEIDEIIKDLAPPDTRAIRAKEFFEKFAKGELISYLGVYSIAPELEKIYPESKSYEGGQVKFNIDKKEIPTVKKDIIGKIYAHTSIPTLKIKILELTTRGYKVLQKNSKGIGKERKEGKIAYFDKQDIVGPRAFFREIKTWEEVKKTEKPAEQIKINIEESTKDESNSDIYGPFTQLGGGEILYNKDFNSIQVKFNQKPEQSIIDSLKAKKFRWYRKQNAWGNKNVEEGKKALREIIFSNERFDFVKPNYKSPKTDKKVKLKPTLDILPDRKNEELVNQGENVALILKDAGSYDAQKAYLENKEFLTSFLQYLKFKHIVEIRKKEQERGDTMYPCRYGTFYCDDILDRKTVKFLMAKIAKSVFTNARITISNPRYSSIKMTLTYKTELSENMLNDIRDKAEEILDSFVKNCSNSQVDYFNRNFYTDVVINQVKPGEKKRLVWSWNSNNAAYLLSTYEPKYKNSYIKGYRKKSVLEKDLKKFGLTLNDVSTFDMYGGRFAAFMEFDFPKFNIIEPHIEK